MFGQHSGVGAQGAFCRGREACGQFLRADRLFGQPDLLGLIFALLALQRAHRVNQYAAGREPAARALDQARLHLGEVGDLAPLPGQFGTAERIVECKHFIVVGDVKRIVGPCDARRRIEVITEGIASFGDAIAICIAQQHEFIRAFAARTGFAEKEARNKVAQPIAALARVELGRPGQSDEDIAVRQRL